MTDADIKLALIRLIDSQEGASLLRLYKLILEEASIQRHKIHEQTLGRLEQDYKRMAEDTEREADATIWIEGTLNSDEL